MGRPLASPPVIRSIYTHERVAWCYDGLAAGYSMGGIARAKAAQIEGLMPGERVLYVGVGSGEDAVLAAEAGANLTCIDVSPAMLSRLRVRLAPADRSALLIPKSVLDHRPECEYDVIIVNFFLNMYREEGVGVVLDHLQSLLTSRGRLLIADFCPPQGNWLRRLLQVGYYRPVNIAAWALGLCALHPLYDYAKFLPGHGFDRIERHGISISRRGPKFFEVLTARRSL